MNLKLNQLCRNENKRANVENKIRKDAEIKNN